MTLGCLLKGMIPDTPEQEEICVRKWMEAVPRPETVAELDALIAAGAKIVSLECLLQPEKELCIPCGVTWVPPFPGLPMDLSGTTDIVSIQGPPAFSFQHQIFTNWSEESVDGYFGGHDIWTSWWEQCDTVNDFGPALRAALNAPRGKGASQTRVNNSDVASAFGISFDGGWVGSNVRVPAGTWTLRTKVPITNKYTDVIGQGTQTAIKVVVDDDRAFEFIDSSANSGFRDMQFFVMPGSSDSMSLFYFDSGFTESTIFEKLLVHGCKRSLFRMVGDSSNHHEIRNCHFVKPLLPTSVAFECDFTVGRLSISDTTVASISATVQWDSAVNISRAGTFYIHGCHFEHCTTAAIHIDPIDGGRRPEVTIHGSTYNYLNGNGNNAGTPFLRCEAISLSSFQFIGSYSRNTNVAIEDPRQTVINNVGPVGTQAYTAGGNLPANTAGLKSLMQTLSMWQKYYNWSQ